MNNTQRHPGWKNAIDMILERVKDKGYGVFFSHEELKEWLRIDPPRTIPESKAKEFEYLNALDHIRTELLEDHCMYLDNKKGEGYIVLVPDDQIEKAPEKLTKKAQAAIRKAAKALIYVNTELVSLESEALRLRKMEKIAFLKKAFGKRKFLEIEAKNE
jgi:hypothetical protein